MTIRYAHLSWTGINLVQEQDSQFESLGVGAWASVTNCTLARSTTNPDTGLASLAVTATASATMSANSGLCHVTPGATVSARVRMRAATTGRTCQLSLQSFQSDGVTASATTVASGSAVSDTTAGYTDVTNVNKVVGSDCYYVKLWVEVTSPSSSEVHRVDTAQVAIGTTNPTFSPGYGDTFAYYELQCDDGDGYKTIAEITNPAILSVDYYSNRRNEVASFRIRYVLTDGSPSAWSAVSTLTVPMSDCGILFVSDFDPTLNLELTDLGDREYTFLDADDMSYTQFHGRDYQAKQQPTEYRGDRFTNTVMLYAEPGFPVPAALKGRRAFSPILATAKASNVPYITVLTEDGDRWYAGLRVPSGIRKEQGGFYTVPIEVTETYGDPIPLDVVV